MKNSRVLTLAVTGLALFAMFFGAGNLIFPVMLGIQAGTNTPLAIAGFIGTGVILPAIGLIAATSSRDGTPQDIATRIGRIPGHALLWAIFITTGVLYAVPRVAAVSFEVAVRPVMHDDAAARPALLVFSAVFFVVAVLVALNPGKMVDRVGGILTPALVILMAILITVVVLHLPPQVALPQAPYAPNALTGGLLSGYMTMDALAAFVFGLVIVSSLRSKGFTSRGALFGGAAGVALIAALILAAIYLGLSQIGVRVATEGFANGADALAAVSERFFGRSGQLIFGAITILACLTTAIGLLGAATQFYRSYLPGLAYRPLLIGQGMFAFAMSTLGLEGILNFINPINRFIYPIAIVLIFVTLVDLAVPGRLHWSYRASAWIAAPFALLDGLVVTEWDIFSPVAEFLALFPLGAEGLAWAGPALLGFVLGLAVDGIQGRLFPPALVRAGADVPAAAPVS
ncbi:branched-chain amino acid transport system II carrier protein [Actinotignum sanguinis]|uniref:Branched-chain amino acid transport system II carrier protein n=2 Tax=Actinomycetaceae TaxID=2049 RepID=A0ABZ0RE62_9ACTO|nr:branched-chain amino acid transport system II carrier protein [Actinotignum sanguinis]WPJ89355.1 branched-chain amino acid transport system II carrier protein [Schaalia turicensis]MDE1552356.1 branched-chain amino acid transport system II carrier protein [Actinotignum sanguinis]MDE1565986.1 branched-chain amino acid transport system II carrier protein [Actinotignum sanguinis]MDE1577253.1 branched-chain amino acid transport system II carrier protein [Actinotignum sanguinis]MDE1656411.1 branc